MKKTMIASAVLFSALAGVCDVSSQNIVGYTSRTLPQATSMMASTMDNIEKQSLYIQDIKVVRTGGDEIEPGVVQMQTLTAGGAADKTIFYLPEGAGEEGAGWYHEDDTGVLYNFSFDFGEGIVITTDYDDTQLTIAGQVDQENTLVPLPQGTSVFGNSRPVELPIQGIEVARTSGDEIEPGVIQMQTLTAGGAADKTIFYLPEGAGEEGAGWYHEDDTSVKYNYAFPSGVGIVITTDYDDTVLTLPKVL